MTAAITLVRPQHAWLPAFERALAAGWSPNTERDLSAAQLAELRRAPNAFLHDLLHGTTVRLADGTPVPRLPAHDFWIIDGEFCGRIGLRFQRGTEELPPYCSGHIGYSVVPWKQRRGYAREALRRILPVARTEGLARVQITCDDDNEASQKVIRAHGGVLSSVTPHAARPGRSKLAFWVATPES
jgi:predicted acetyltransferase